MSIEQFPTRENPPYPQADSAQSGRWRKRGLLTTGIVALLIFAGSWITAAMSPDEEGPRLTHTVTRGDLLVTVVEQGTLESSENVEIKCKVRGRNAVLWVIKSGTMVEPGDELIRLDTLSIEEQIDERTKYAHWSQSAADGSKARVASTELAVPEYEQGRFVSQLLNQEKNLAVAKSRLTAEKNMLAHAKVMAESGYISELEVEERDFAVKQAELAVQLQQTEIDVLKRFTKEEQLQNLKSNFEVTKATHKANVERAMADASRRDRALAEVQHCVIKADRAGMVIHPSAARWSNAPEVAEGAMVYQDQVLLLMPDLNNMLVKVGVHEAIVDRVKEGQVAHVTIPDATLQGTVSSVSSVTRPAGWWTGNEVRYDTLVDLPPEKGLRPGMSAQVELIIAEYEDVLQIPVAAIVESDKKHYCWIKKSTGIERRTLTLGDSNEVFTIVEQGLDEGDEVVLNPLAFAEAQKLASKKKDDKEIIETVPTTEEAETDS